MFTTLTVNFLPRQTLTEKLHLVRKRQFRSQFIDYGDDGFYVTELVTYCKNNSDAINKFRRRCGMPVISPTDSEVLLYRQNVLANTLFKSFYTPPKLGVYDLNGDLLPLFPKFLIKSQSLAVVTERVAEYEEENQNLNEKTGAAAIISESRGIFGDINCLFAANRLDFPVGVPVFCESGGGFSCGKIKLPQTLEELMPPFVERYSVACALSLSTNNRTFTSAVCDLKK